MFKPFQSRIFYSLLAVGFLASGSAAHAAVTTYDFGNLLTASSGYTAPNSFESAPFAQLAATDNGSGIWTFMLTIQNNLFSSFGDGAFIGSMSFDFTPDPAAANPPTTFLGSNVDGVTSVKSTSGTGLSGLTDIDFGTAFGQGAKNRLSQNDWVSWSVSGLGTSSLTNMYVHVQGIDGGYSAKYTPITSPVPEPETYTMILAGLGLIGFTARRRKQNS
jgi:PEP-CTERM motif